MSESKTTSLYDFHLSKNEKVIDFAGWSMPFSYDGTLKEHHYVESRQVILMYLIWVDYV